MNQSNGEILWRKSCIRCTNKFPPLGKVGATGKFWLNWQMLNVTVVRLDTCQQHNLEKLVNFYQYNIHIPHCLKSLGMIQKQGNWVPHELKPKKADFEICQRSVQCCKIGENLFENAEMGALTPPAVLSRRYSFRLPFVSIYDPWPVWVALHTI